MAERGVASARAAEVAAYRTRDAKDYGVDPDGRRAEWISRAAEFDLSAESIDTTCSPESRPRADASPVATLRRPSPRSRSSRSHFDRRDLICALANQLAEGAGAGGAAGAPPTGCSHPSG